MIKRYSLFVSTLILSCSAYSQDKGLNVVFIMADDLGLNDTGYTGSDFYETPNIDRLSESGMIFTNAYSSAANSAPSRACFMSGMYTPRHGIFTVSPPDRGDRTKRKLIPVPNVDDLRTDITTLGELFKRNGYRCGHVGKWHLGDDSDGTGPLSRGFDVNIAGCRAGTPYSYYYPYCNKKNECHTGLENGKPGEYLTDRLTDEAVGFIRESARGDKPFFLYLAHHAVHTPITAPKEIVDKYKRKPKGKYHKNPVYAAMIETLDNSVGKICDIIDSLGISDNTVIIFNSDNGGSEPITDNFMVRGGKGMPYEGGNRVPLIVKWPDVTKAGSASDCPVNNIDFFSTFQMYLEGKTGNNLDGVDIYPLLKDEKSYIERDLFWHFPAYLESYTDNGNGFRAKPYTSVRSGRWKLIYYYENENVELFDLVADPKEEHNVASQSKEIVSSLKKKIFNWIEAVGAPVPTELNPYYEDKRLKQK